MSWLSSPPSTHPSRWYDIDDDAGADGAGDVDYDDDDGDGEDDAGDAGADLHRRRACEGMRV